MCTERAQDRELERKRGGKGRKGEKERDKEKNLGAKKPKLALVEFVNFWRSCFMQTASEISCALFSHESARQVG